MKTDLEKRVLGCINRVLFTSMETLEPEINLKDGLEMDSAAMIMLHVEIEDEFQFMFDALEDDFEKIFETFGSLCGYLENKRQI